MAIHARRLALGVCAVATLAIAAPSAMASHFSSPATYTGTVAGGGTVSFDVAQSAVTRFAVADVPTKCGTFTTSFTGTVVISDDAFTQPSPPLSFGGSFPTAQQAIGTLQLRSVAPSCSADPLTWSAATTTPPPPETDVPAPDLVNVHALLPEKVVVSTRRHEGLSSLRNDGLRVGLECPTACVATSTIELSRTGARRIGIAAAAVSLGKATAVIPSGGELIYRVKLGSQARRALAGIRSINLTLRTRVLRTGLAAKVLLKKVRITSTSPKNHKPHFPAGLVKTVATDYDFTETGSISGGVTTVTLAAPAIDPDGDPLAYTWTASNGSVTAVGRRAAWERLADAGQLAAGSLTVTVADARGGKASTTFRFARGAG